MKKKTLSEFIVNFNNKYPKKCFDFTNSIYVDTHTPMEVICDRGHHFNIRPCDLLSGGGCSECYGNKKMTKETFIQEANYVHNNYFSYKNCNFTNVSSPVIVTCPIHGNITVKASNHLNGANCKYCSKEGIKHKITKRKKKNHTTKKVTFEDFCQKVKNRYDDKYIINSDTNFIDYKTKITVNCQEHGEFQITPSHLLGGRGCPTCGKNKKKNLKEIIDLIQKANPYADYDFSQTVYKGIHVPILIKCNKCGTTFKNSPSNLITYKNGCNGCGGSQLELEIKDFLKKNNIKFHREKTFEWLKDKRNLKLDFYLDDYNVAIECQGLQHFEQVRFQKDKLTSLDEIKNRDILKRTLCEKNGIKLFYYANYPYEFPYFVYEDKSKMLNDIKFFKKN